MQELLGRIAALDPEASLGIRVIACFDELVVGGVNTRGLLAASAALAGCVAGCSWTKPSRRVLRVDPLGRPVVGERPEDAAMHPVGGTGEVWLERTGSPLAHDAIILERLALAVQMRRVRPAASPASRRPLLVLLDQEEPLITRREAAVRLGLLERGTYRVLVAPLSAVWTTRPEGPSDVVGSHFGPVHASIVDAGADVPRATLLGVGTAVTVGDLPRSFATAFTAVRLAHPRRHTTVSADRYGSLLDLLAEAEQSGNSDADRIGALIGAHVWAESTIEALCESTTLRQSARHAGVHHSTLQARIDTLADELGFDLLDPFGRTRLTLAFLLWRLRTSHAFELPVPPIAAVRASTTVPGGR